MNSYDLQAHLTDRGQCRIWNKRTHSYLPDTFQLAKKKNKADYFKLATLLGNVRDYTVEQAVGYTDATGMPIFINDICFLPNDFLLNDAIGTSEKQQALGSYFLVSFAPSKGDFALYGKTVRSFADVNLNALKVVGNTNKNNNLLAKVNLTEYYHEHPDEVNG